MAGVDVIAVLDRLVREVPMGCGHLRAIAEARAALAGTVAQPEAFRVTWVIDIDEATPIGAAREAFEHMQRPGTSANCFTVRARDGETFEIDLSELEAE